MSTLWRTCLALSLCLISCTRIVHDRAPADSPAAQIVGGGTQASGGTGDLFGGGGSYEDAIAKNRLIIAKALGMITAGTDLDSLCRQVDDLDDDQADTIKYFLAVHGQEMATFAGTVDIKIVSSELTVAGHAVKARVGKPAGATNFLVEIRSTAFDAKEGIYLTVHELAHLVENVPDFADYAGFPGQRFLDNLGRCAEGYFADHSSPGELDVTLNGTGWTTVVAETFNDAESAPDGSVYVVSTVTRNGHGECVVRRFVDGVVGAKFESVTTGFQNTQGAGRLCNTITVQSDGKALVAGVIRFSDIPEKVFVMRINADGTRDPSFSGDGDLQMKLHPLHSGATKLTLRPDGKIIVGGIASNGTRMGFVTVQLTPNGDVDGTFAQTAAINLGSRNNMVWSTAVDAAGRIVLAGAFSDILERVEGRSTIVRLRSDGSLDPALNGATIPLAGGDSSPRAVAPLPDGGFLVAGRIGNDAASLDAKAYLALYRASGAREMNFGNNGIKTMGFGTGGSNFYSLARQSDGKFLVAGSSVDVTGTQAALLRLLPSGEIDPGFVQRGRDGGRAIFSIEGGNTVARRVLPLPDGKIAVVGTTRTAGGIDGFFMARLYGDSFGHE